MRKPCEISTPLNFSNFPSLKGSLEYCDWEKREPEQQLGNTLLKEVLFHGVDLKKQLKNELAAGFSTPVPAADTILLIWIDVWDILNTSMPH